MHNLRTLKIAAAASIVAAALAAPAFAATVNVAEGGEDAGPMTLTLDPASVPAGETTFTVKNNAATAEHEMVVVRLKSADEAIPMNKSNTRVDEKKLKSLGEVGDIKPGASGTLKAKLKEGTYLVFCNYKGHYQAGMASKLTVTK